jgi:hypothetical protein
MAKKIILPTALALLLIISCIVPLQVGKAQLPSQIYIKADGSVTPATAPIQSVGNVYKVTADIYNTSLIVERNNIVLDGQGFTLQGNGSLNNQAAINLTCIGVTVEHFHINGWQVGVLGNFDSNRVVNNDFANNHFDIAIYANNYQITQNYLSYVRIQGNNIDISQNQIRTRSYTAFWISSSSGIVIESNEITFSSDTTSFIGSDSGNIQVYHNNFLNPQGLQEDKGQCLLLILPYVNATNFPWDNGFPSGGNYWSDYTLRFVVSEIDNSGIGNTTYVSTSSNVVDRYPHISPYNVSIPIIPTPPPTQTIKPSPNPTQTPSAPELPTWVILLLAASVLLLTVFFKKKITEKPTDTFGA